jgi:hypothetical protein
MDDNVARWLQVYKLKQGLTDWNTFIVAVEEQFGRDCGFNSERQFGRLYLSLY